MAEIDRLASTGLTDSQACAFLAERLGPNASYPANQAWRVLKAWLVHFFPETYMLETGQEVVVKGKELSSYPRRNIASLPSQYLHIFVKYHQLCGSVIGGQDSGGTPATVKEPCPGPGVVTGRSVLYHKNSSVIRLRPKYQNHIWSIDFVHDKLANGRPYKMLTVLDEYSREALCVAVKPRMGNA
ncbi:MAG: hypothetical protein VCD33_04465, partial [Alphaproteobacteria bacterium]